MRLRFGICGLGFAGAVLMAPSMREHPNSAIVAACDPNQDTREKFGADYQIPTFATLKEMIDGSDIDAVYVASPHQFHCQHVVQAAESGLHIIVEKPLTLDLDAADNIISAVKSRGVQLVVGTSRSHDPVVRTMREVILSGEAGRLAMLNTWNFTNFLYRPRRLEELDTSKGGGIVFNQLPHQIDSIKMISNEQIVSVRAHAAGLDPQRPTEGHCAAFLTLTNGVHATVVYSGYDHFDSDELQFWIAEGGQPKKPNHGGARKLLKDLGPGEEPAFRTRHYGYGGPISKGRAGPERKQPHFGIMIATCERADLRFSPEGILFYGDDGVREIPAIIGRGSPSQGDTIDELLDAISGERPALRTAEWGRDTVNACLAILESTRTGQEVRL